VEFGPEQMIRLSYLNGQEATYREIQEDIDRARKKYFDVPEIQLKLDRRQADLDKLKRAVMKEKESMFNPN
jgi:hypothetical protein